MKNPFKLFLASAALALAFGLISCNNNNTMGPSNPGSNPTPTPGPSGPTVTAAGSYPSYSFSPSSLSITAGTTVTFNLASIHTANIDTGSCTILQDKTGTSSYTFNTKGTYVVHCDNHSCGSSCNTTSCTGMVMTITVY